jgi:hypothetical protein
MASISDRRASTAAADTTGSCSASSNRSLDPLTIDLGEVGVHEGFDEFWRKEAILQSRTHPRQDLVAEHSAAIGARVSLAMIGTSETAMFSNDRHAATAEPAAHQP